MKISTAFMGMMIGDIFGFVIFGELGGIIMMALSMGFVAFGLWQMLHDPQ